MMVSDGVYHQRFTQKGLLFVYFLCTSRQTIRSFLLFFLEVPFIFSIFATNNVKFEMSPGKIGTVPIWGKQKNIFKYDIQ